MTTAILETTKPHVVTEPEHDEYDDLAWGMLAMREDAVEHQLERIRAWG